MTTPAIFCVMKSEGGFPRRAAILVAEYGSARGKFGRVSASCIDPMYRTA